MSMNLISQNKKFSSLFWTQFLGALNDNLLKNALIVLVTYRGISLGILSTQSLVAAAGAIFILPFFFLSPISGQLSDLFAKSTIVRRVKEMELVIMVICAMGFLFSHFELLFICLFLMGIHSTLFGPVKYSMIPELVADSHLLTANALIEVGTFLAILIGTILGGLLVSFDHGELWISGGLILCSLIGIFFGYKVPRINPPQTQLKLQWNPFPEIFRSSNFIKKNILVYESVKGISWFWFYGAALLSLLPIYAKNILLCDEHVVTLFLGLFTIGIAVGSILCAKISKGQLELGIVPVGCLGLTLFLIDLCSATPIELYTRVQSTDPQVLKSLTQFLSEPYSIRIIFDLFFISVSGGIYTVPLYTIMQHHTEASHRSRVVAYNNILNAVYMVGSAVIIMGLNMMGAGTISLFLIFALMNLFISFRTYLNLPHFTLRFWAWIVSKFMYKIKVHGINHIPKEGPAVLISNHVTFIDWLIISAEIRRPIRYVMYYKYAKSKWVFNFLKKHGGVIFIAGAKEDPLILKTAFEQIDHALKNNELVCLFPEGFLTRDGNIGHLKPGIKQILEQNPVQVVPMVLINLWGSMFSRHPNRHFFKGPRGILTPIEMRVGEPIEPQNARVSYLEEVLNQLFKK